MFHPDGRHVYVACELESVVAVCGYDPGTGALWKTGAVSTLPLGTEGWNAPSAVALSPGGRFGYVLNRGHESIAVLRVQDGGLVRQDVLRLGDTFTTMPWHLLPDPSGTRMFVANQLAGTVLTLAVDPESGLLSPLGAPLKVTDAAFLAFGPR